MELLAPQFIHFFAALMLLLNFAMLLQRRMHKLITLLALQGLVLSIDIAGVAYMTKQPELYITVILTLFLKVWIIPFILHQLLNRLKITPGVETIVNFPTTLLIGIMLVIFAFNISIPISQVSHHTIPTMLALALASVLVALFMMIIKRKATSQVCSLLSLENSLFFVAASSSHSMPLIVELGIAFDILIAVFIFGIFFFRIRENFENLDLHHLEKLRDD